MMQNIRGNSIEEKLKEATIKTKKELSGLTEEQMCKVYNGTLLRILQEFHVSARGINSLDLGLDYEHFFLLIPLMSGSGYLLADLTFSQFKTFEENWCSLLTTGYQKMNDEDFNHYLYVINNRKMVDRITLDDVFYLQIEENRKI